MVIRLSLVSAPAVLALGLLVFAAPARAVTYYDAALLGINEATPNASTATGFGQVILNDAMNEITADLNWSGLVAPASGAHIHTGVVGVAGPVTFGFSGVPNVTTGSIATQSFAINAAQLANLEGGNMYMNVHNAQFPGGEIRGQLLARTAPIPEPGTAAMLLGAAPGALWALRRRRNA